MGKVTVQQYTTLNPISLCGEEAGICWGADTSSYEANKKRGIACINSGHGRVMEYPQVYLVLEGYSARVIRELYTHIGGGPTRLQASTRYIQYGDFDFVLPPSVEKNGEAKSIYSKIMKEISAAYRQLEDENIPKEDIANILPLGMETKIVVRTNLRNLLDMAHQRLCSRAYWEFRQLMRDIMKALSEYSDEWQTLVNLEFVPKCKVCGFCIEERGCGLRPNKDKIAIVERQNLQVYEDDGK